jgi:polyisoprenoid-binding protein YceI
MKTKYLIITIIVLLSTSVFGQRFITKTGHIWFHSDAPLETIEAHNNQVNAAMDINSGAIVFKVLMKSFIFEKALMQEHFNENYVESTAYPNATFQGKITNLDDIDFSSPGNYNAEITGELTIHNVTNKVTATGTFEVTPEIIHGKSKFSIQIADYNISIPEVVAGKIAEQVDINVDIQMKELKK